MGFGSLLDTARMRYVLSKATGKPLRSIEALVIGQHDECMVPVFSHSFIDGESVLKVLSEEERKRVAESVRISGARVIRLRGYSPTHAPGAGVADMVEAVVRNKPLYTQASVVLMGEYGVHGIPLGAPCILSGRSVERIIEISLTREEMESFRRAALKVRSLIDLLPEHLKSGF